MPKFDDLTPEQQRMYDRLDKNCPHKPCFVGVFYGACYLLETPRVLKTPTPLVRGKGITWKA